MISGSREGRRKTMAWSALASAAFHVVVLSLLFYAFARIVITPEGSRESVSDTTAIEIEAPIVQKRTVKHHRVAKPASQPPPAPAYHELAKENIEAPPQPPPPQHPHPAGVSSIERDRTAFAQEVAQLNQGNSPHAIPTIDPASAESASKSYAFDAGRYSNGDSHGNGLITPVRGWHERGLDCYYARYEYTYPSGASEEGSIPWPVCFDPASDPFHEPPHPMPFPLPEAGYTLPPGTVMPPLERQAYQEWLSSRSASP